MPKATAPVFDVARPRTHAREKSRFARPRVEIKAECLGSRNIVLPDPHSWTRAPRKSARKGSRARLPASTMPAKRASSAVAGSGATKRRVKSTARRPYPPPKNMMIRAPSGAPVDATVEDTDSDADSDDSDDSDADSDSGSESESMEVDEDTGEEVTTARPLGRATERRLLKTTRYEYDAASCTTRLR